ncbi:MULTISPECIES: hypothetical protein [Pseudomonas]|uniref:Uncharacterized protein n=1 Tax=Pseudomonas multiresinivorans TaxID=95301 RepID=A0A7Z3GRT5_9PSED|nr:MULTISPECIES: hypothetical protein [Pseudomonas]MCG8910272.1 hypothetical protein [Pseudomonas sp. DP-17]QJP10009.1 hypothetical protein G4G71_19715 [Pseudomonas multiresinivorans]
MGEINTSRFEREALKALNMTELRKQVDNLVHSGQSGQLHGLGLTECGQFVGTNLHAFERALLEHRQAKSPTKRDRTMDSLLRAGRNLIHAVEERRRVVEEEEHDSMLFTVDDMVDKPTFFSQKLTVRVSYSWRAEREAKWMIGSIDFIYECDRVPSAEALAAGQKKGMARAKRERQVALQSEWNFLRRSALFSVRDYFKNGGNGAEIPKTYEVRKHPHGSVISHRSTDFWHWPSRAIES